MSRPVPVGRPAPVGWPAPTSRPVPTPVRATAVGRAPVAPAPATYAPAPSARAPWSPGPWLVGGSVFLVVLLCVAAVAVTLRPAVLFGEPTPAVTASAVPAAAEPVLVRPTASAELAAQVDRDRAQVESVTGWWVPQLSSKRPGTVDGGVRYDDDTILAHYRGLAAQYPGAALLWSGDWPVFQGSDYWVVVVAQPFPTAAQANAWCDEQGFGADDCLAKTLSHTDGPTGTTVTR